MKKREGNIKKLQKLVIICFLTIQFLFLNPFSTFLSCRQNCCHNSAPVKETCCCACETEQEKSCPNDTFYDNLIKNQCNCFHPEKTTETYIVECKFKSNASLIDLFTQSPAISKKRYSVTFEKQNNLIKSNSPPIYISNSSLTI